MEHGRNLAERSFVNQVTLSGLISVHQRGGRQSRDRALVLVYFLTRTVAALIIFFLLMYWRCLTNLHWIDKKKSVVLNMKRKKKGSSFSTYVTYGPIPFIHYEARLFKSNVKGNISATHVKYSINYPRSRQYISFLVAFQTSRAVLSFPFLPLFIS